MDIVEYGPLFYLYVTYAELTSLSIGIAVIVQETYENEQVSYDFLYHKADEQLYTAKKSGKGILSIIEL